MTVFLDKVLSVNVWVVVDDHARCTKRFETFDKRIFKDQISFPGSTLSKNLDTVSYSALWSLNK